MDPSRLQVLQEKLSSSVWKRRLKKKETSETTVQSAPAKASTSGTKTEHKESRKTESKAQISNSSNDSAQFALEVVEGLSHLRRALETMRKSDAPREAFFSSATLLRDFNDELSDWKDMYFSRDPEAHRAGQRALSKSSSGDEKEKSKNLIEIKGEWSLDEPPTPAAMPSYLQNSAATISSANIGTIQPSLSSGSWFMIGPAQPRFSATAAIRRGALEPLIEVPRDQAKLILAQFAHIASAETLSRCVRAISTGGFVDLDWFHQNALATVLQGVRLGDCGISFTNWYRCFEFVIKIGQTIGAPDDYLKSLTAYRRVMELWWHQVAAIDIQAAALLWLPFYELFDKSWRMYAARSPEYRNKLHIFDAWWVFHQLDPAALKLRVPLPPYEAQSSAYVRQVAAHYEEMLRKPIPPESMSNYTSQRFDTGLDACSVCGDWDHKIKENGRAVPIFCPFTSRRISWCPNIYEGGCDNAECQREGTHLCAHCGNRGHVVQTCPNCKCLVS